MSLESVQAGFAAAMFDAKRAPALLPFLMRLDERTADRIALYRGNLAAAWQKALANAFPVARMLVGEEFFDALARMYGQLRPSPSGDLNRFGEQFPGFVTDFEHTRSMPWLADVAKLEWQVHRAYYAADALPLPRKRMAGFQPQELLGLRLALHPACAWVDSGFPITRIWHAHQPDTEIMLPESLDCAEIALILRPRWRVEVVESSVGEIAALDALRSAATLATAIESALGADERFDFAGALLRWLDLGLLIGIDDPLVD